MQELTYTTNAFGGALSDPEALPEEAIDLVRVHMSAPEIAMGEKPDQRADVY